MKKSFSMVVAALLAVTTLAFSACGGAEKKDLSTAKSLADLKGARISAQSGTFHESARLQIEDVQGQIYDSFDAMYIALNSGALDGYIAEEPTAITLCYKNSSLGYVPLINNDTGFSATDADTALAVGCKKGSDWTETINPVLQTITTEQRSALMQEIVRANADEVVESFSVANEEPAQTTGVLKVAMECAYAPFNWTQRDDKNGAVAISGAGMSGMYANGYDVQIAKYVANALGLKLEIYSSKWESLIPGVQAGTYDLIIAGMSPTAERMEEIDFSDIYYSSNLVVIYKK